MNKISIITVVYNDVKHIKSTIESVLNQTYSNIEYIIIDGGSLDGTVDLIDNYKLNISYFISEQDQGIYDAMNKGIRNSTGDWLIFLNSGDLLYNKNTITDLNNSLTTDAEIVYGDVRVESETMNLSFKRTAKEISNILNGMVISHQAFVIKRSLHITNYYDTRYRIAADYNFMLKSFLQGKLFLKVPITISIISAGGLSDTNRIASFKEYLTIKNTLNYNYILRNYLHFLKQRLYATFIKGVKLITPKSMVIRLYKRKYKISSDEN